MKTQYSKSGIPYLHFGNGEPLVLIHGLGEVKEGWKHQYELSDQYELIIPDLRGHGEYITDKEIGIEQFASDVIGLLDELNITSAHICGLSMGGAVAQEIYRQKPSVCKSLILASTFHYFPEQLGSLLLRTRDNISRSVEDAAKLSLYSWDGQYIDEFKSHFKPNKEAFFQSLKSCLKVNNLTLLPNITVPTFIIGGQYDSVIPVWVQLWMHKLMKHSKFTILRNVGHVGKLEAKDRFNGLVRDFLVEVR